MSSTRPVGIEALHAYCGRTSMDIPTLFRHRGLDPDRMANLRMAAKSVALHCEDAVSFAVNAARPLVEALTEEERATIELVVVGTESGVDFGKSVTSYVHHYLGLPRTCRLFEVKQACYSATAALQMAANTVAASPHEDARALVISSDVALPVPHSYIEPSQGAGAVALLVGARPTLAELDRGANGFHSYEVMDTCRPTPGTETGDTDLSLLTYLDCLQGAFADYASRTRDVDIVETFDLLAMHTPFPGMVRGAHRTLLRRLRRMAPPEIEEDFTRRLAPSLHYPSQVGNIYGGTVLLALASAISHTELTGEARVGVFSYGSGCSSEFFSCVVSPESHRAARESGLDRALDNRHRLSPEEYDALLSAAGRFPFGTADLDVDLDLFPHLTKPAAGAGPLLVLESVRGYHRRYVWIGGDR
ncbi:hydroxymethylglutaryl-CoA synthase family protein [Streptomyces bohaiensis]|uniref:hydroxymethylglutaryl-CoA synthase family protein n=1 Tax=Streptomyces bohaiensis TaxID=1431344 RepID=UPI003B7BE098